MHAKEETKKVLVAVLLVTTMSLPSFWIGYYIGGPSALTSDPVLEHPTEADYIIFIGNSTYYAKNGSTGEIEYSGTSCSNVIQSIVDNSNSGVHMHFKRGIYNIDSTISVTKHIRVTGEDMGPPWETNHGAILRLTANVSMFLWNHTSHIFLGHFEHITLDGNYMCLTESVDWWQWNIGVANLITIRGNVSDLIFENVVFINCGTEAIAITAVYGNVWNIWIQNCFIEDNVGAGIGMITADDYRVERVIIRNNHFHDNVVDIHIADDGVNDVIVSDNTSELTGGCFLRTTLSGRDIVASNNMLCDGGARIMGGRNSDAFWLDNTQHSIFSGNIIKNLENDSAWEGGFYLESCRYVQIENNNVYNITADGIVLDEDSNDNLVLGNIVQGNGGKGIYIATSTCNRNTILDNISKGNTGVNIHDKGSLTEIHSCWNGTSWID